MQKESNYFNSIIARCYSCRTVTADTLRISAVIFFLLLTPTTVSAQQTEFQDKLEDYLESSFSEDETKDVEQLMDDLLQAKHHPVNINAATADELSKLIILDRSQINALLEYRKKYGRIFSVFEMAAIEGFNKDIAQLLGEFVVFDESLTEKTFKSYSENEVMLRGIRQLETQAAYLDPKKYEGSPDKLYLRYRYSTDNIQAGFTGEKDAGESFFRGENKSGFDFNSVFVKIGNDEKKPSIILGDYVVQFGQGLVAWQGFSLGKSSEVNNVAKFNQGAKAYSSSDENNYLRGAAVSFRSGRFHFTPFISLKKFDANTDSIDGKKVFTSFQTSGYHRTESEITDKNSTRSVTAGNNLTFEGEKISIGLTGLYTHYQFPLERRNDAYNQYLFEGNQVGNLSVDYKWSINNIFVFGELASSFEKGLAGLNGILYQPFDKIKFSAIYRNIGKKYNSPLAASFTENSRVNDEEGFYIGAKVFPVAKVSLDMYADFFRYKSIKYTTAAPGSGQEYMLQATFTPTERWKLYGRYKYEIKPVKTTVDGERVNIDQLRQSVRMQLTGDLGENFTIKTRVELSFFRHDHNSSGVFISQDLGYHPAKTNVSIWARTAWFKTDDYDSRIYAWENDMLYQFSVPAFYGEGCRFYLSGKVKICEKTEFWLKASRSCFVGVESLGSGYSLVDDNKRTELKMQLRYRF